MSHLQSTSFSMAAVGEEEEPTVVELEVAAILADLKRILRLRARDRRRWRRQQSREHGKPAAGATAEKDRVASPDTPLAFLPEEAEELATTMSEENADLLKKKKQQQQQQIDEDRDRLMSSRSASESMKQLHEDPREQPEQACRRRVLLPLPGTMAQVPLVQNNPPPLAALGLVDVNAEEAAARAAQERFRRLQNAAQARRRRMEIRRAKVPAPLVSGRGRARRF